MGKGACFIKAVLHMVNRFKQRKVMCSHFRLISSNEVQTVFRLSPSLFSQPCRFRRAVKSASFPPGEAKEVCTNSPWCIPNGILRTAADPSGAVAPSSYCVLSSCTPPFGRLHLLNLSGALWIGTLSLPPLGVVLRAANQDSNDCRWQSYLCFVPRSGKGGDVGDFEL